MTSPKLIKFSIIKHLSFSYIKFIYFTYHFMFIILFYFKSSFLNYLTYIKSNNKILFINKNIAFQKLTKLKIFLKFLLFTKINYLFFEKMLNIYIKYIKTYKNKSHYYNFKYKEKIIILLTQTLHDFLIIKKLLSYITYYLVIYYKQLNVNFDFDYVDMLINFTATGIIIIIYKFVNTKITGTAVKSFISNSKQYINEYTHSYIVYKIKHEIQFIFSNLDFLYNLNIKYYFLLILKLANFNLTTIFTIKFQKQLSSIFKKIGTSFDILYTNKPPHNFQQTLTHFIIYFFKINFYKSYYLILSNIHSFVIILFKIYHYSLIKKMTCMSTLSNNLMNFIQFGYLLLTHYFLI